MLRRSGSTVALDMGCKTGDGGVWVQTGRGGGMPAGTAYARSYSYVMDLVWFGAIGTRYINVIAESKGNVTTRIVLYSPAAPRPHLPS